MMETQTRSGWAPTSWQASIARTGLVTGVQRVGDTRELPKTAKTAGSNVKILASPWTAPAAWKTNNSRVNGGKLKTDYYDDYANHLNSYVQYMRGQGVPIDVTSVQNEPANRHPDYDSMDWSGTRAAHLRPRPGHEGAEHQTDGRRGGEPELEPHQSRPNRMRAASPATRIEAGRSFIVCSGQ